jgi:WD40 repeat protein
MTNRRAILALILVAMLQIPSQTTRADGGPITDPYVWARLEEGQQTAVVTLNPDGTAHTDLFASVVDHSQERNEFTFFVPLGIEARDIDVQEMKGDEFDRAYTKVLDQRFRADWEAQQAYRDRVMDAVFPGALLLNGGVPAWLGALLGGQLYKQRPRPTMETKLEAAQIFETPSGRVAIYDMNEGLDIDALITEENLPEGVHKTLEEVRGQRLAVVTLITNPDAEGEVLPTPEPEAATLRLWDVLSGQEIPTELAPVEAVRAVAFSPDGSRLAVVTGDGATVWDLDADAPVSTFEGRGDILAFSPDGKGLVVGSGTFLEFWDISSATRTVRWDDEDLEARGFGRHPRLNQVAFSPDGRFLAAAGQRLVVLDTATYEHVASFDAEQDAEFTNVGFSPDGKWMAATSDSLGPLSLYATATWTLQTTVQREWRSEGLAFSPGSDRVAAVSGESSLGLWGLPEGTLAQSLEMDRTWVATLAFSADGSTLSAVGGSNTMFGWDLATGQLLTRIRLADELGAARVAAYAPDGNRVALGYDKRVSEIEQIEEAGLRLSWISAMQPDASGQYVHRYPLGTGKAWAHPIPLTRVYVVAPPGIGFKTQTPAIGEDYSGFVPGGYGGPRLRIYDAPRDQPAHALNTAITPDGQLWRSIYTNANPGEDLIITQSEPLALPRHYAPPALVPHVWWMGIGTALVMWLLAWRTLMGWFVDPRYGWSSRAFWRDSLYWLTIGPIRSLAFLPFLLMSVLAGYEFSADTLVLSPVFCLSPLILVAHGMTAYRFARSYAVDRPASVSELLKTKTFWGFLIVVFTSNAVYLALACATVAYLGRIG